VTSEREAAIVRSLAPDTPLVSVPNGVDAGYFAPQADTLPDPASIVFSANLGYRPNVDAALYFVREIFPLILRQCPEAIFTIVGTGAPAEIQQLASRRIIITGRVPDVRPFIAKAAVFVVPIRYGSGTRLKVLEALAMRMPVVSTSLGAEGIPVLDGRHLLLADDPEPFATSVLRLLEDRSLARTLATCGRDMVLQEFRWEHLARRLDVLHGQALERAAARDHHA
jgi:glycosyltransferase involved in cell wall biosynthesis